MQVSSLGIGPSRHGQEGFVSSWPQNTRLARHTSPGGPPQRNSSPSVGFASQVCSGSLYPTRSASSPRFPVPSGYPDAAWTRVHSPQRVLVPSPRQTDGMLRVRSSVALESPRRSVVEVPCQSLTKTDSSQTIIKPSCPPQVPYYQGQSCSASSKACFSLDVQGAPNGGAPDQVHSVSRFTSSANTNRSVPLTRVSLQDLAGLVKDLSRYANIPCLAEQHVIEAAQRLSAARVIVDSGLAEAEILRSASFESLNRCKGLYGVSARNVVCRLIDSSSTWILRAVFAGWLSSARKSCASPLASVFDDSAHYGGACLASSLRISHECTSTFLHTTSLQHSYSIDELLGETPNRKTTWQTRWATWVGKFARHHDEDTCYRCFSAWRRDTDRVVLLRSFTAAENIQKELAAMQDASRILSTTKTLQEEAVIKISQKFSSLQEKVVSWTSNAAQNVAIPLLLSRCVASWRYASTVRAESERRAGKLELQFHHRRRTTSTIARCTSVMEDVLIELCLRSWHHEVVRSRSSYAYEQQLVSQSLRIAELSELVETEASASRTAATHEAIRQCRSSTAMAVDAYCWRQAMELERRILSFVFFAWLAQVSSSIAARVQQASSVAAEAVCAEQEQSKNATGTLVGLLQAEVEKLRGVGEEAQAKLELAGADVNKKRQEIVALCGDLDKARTSDWELRARFAQRRATFAKRCGVLRTAANARRYFAAWRHGVDSAASLQMKALERVQDSWRNAVLGRSALSAWRQYARCSGLLLRRWRAHSLALIRVIMDVWRFSIFERRHPSSGPSTPRSTRSMMSRFLPITESVSTATPSQASPRSSTLCGGESRSEGKRLTPRSNSKTSSAASSGNRENSREASAQRHSRRSEPSVPVTRSHPQLPHTFVHLKDLCIAEIDLSDEACARRGQPAPRRPKSQGFVSTPSRGHRRPSHGATWA